MQQQQGKEEKRTTSCYEKSGFVSRKYSESRNQSWQADLRIKTPRKKLTVENLVRGFLERRIK